MSRVDGESPLTFRYRDTHERLSRELPAGRLFTLGALPLHERARAIIEMDREAAAHRASVKRTRARNKRNPELRRLLLDPELAKQAQTLAQRARLQGDR